MLLSEYNIVLKEKPLDEGLSQEEVIDLMDLLSGRDMIPIEIQANNSSAMGFINLTDAEFMNYDYSGLIQEVRRILNDMENEREDCTYYVKNNCGESSMYLSR